MGMKKRNFGGEFIEVAINVPSGKLVFGNDFLQQYETKNMPERDVNQCLGRKQVTEDFAKLGLLHACVGNSSPTIYQKGNRFFVGGSEDQGKDIGFISTDLWWYSIADHDDYVKRGGKFKDGEFVVDVTPGRYVLKHRAEWQDDSEKCFAILERSDKPLKSCKMPEEGIIEAITELLPAKIKAKNTSIDIRPHYERVGKGYGSKNWRFKGYKISGFLGGEGKFNTEGFKWGTLVDIIVQEKELRNPKKLLAKLLDSYCKHRVMDEAIEKDKKKPLVLSEETKALIRKIWAQAKQEVDSD